MATPTQQARAPIALGEHAMPDDELFAVYRVEIDLAQNDLPGKPLSRVACDHCGEWVQDGREVKEDEATICKSCHGQRYYRIL